MNTQRMTELHGAFCALDANVLIGHRHFSVTKGYCFARHTSKGWLLFRSGRDQRGRFYAEECTDDIALAFIETGAVAVATPAKPTNGNGKKVKAREELSSAILDHFGAEGVETERLLEALEVLAH